MRTRCIATVGLALFLALAGGPGQPNGVDECPSTTFKDRISFVTEFDRSALCQRLAAHLIKAEGEAECAGFSFTQRPWYIVVRLDHLTQERREGFRGFRVTLVGPSTLLTGFNEFGFDRVVLVVVAGYDANCKRTIDLHIADGQWFRREDFAFAKDISNRDQSIPDTYLESFRASLFELIFTKDFDQVGVVQ